MRLLISGLMAILAALAISGCVTIDMPDPGTIAKSMYNVQESGKSEFDGEKYVRVRNVACPGNGSTIMFDLYQDTKMAGDGAAILTLKVVGAHTIGDKHSLHFNIDGNILDLESIDKVATQVKVFPAVTSPGYVGGGTYVSPIYSPATYAASKRYRLTRSVIEVIGNAKRVVVRADLAREFVDGTCSEKPGNKDVSKEYSWAKELAGTAGFKRFAEMMKTLTFAG